MNTNIKSAIWMQNEIISYPGRRHTTSAEPASMMLYVVSVESCCRRRRFYIILSYMIWHEWWHFEMLVCNRVYTAVGKVFRRCRMKRPTPDNIIRRHHQLIHVNVRCRCANEMRHCSLRLNDKNVHRFGVINLKSLRLELRVLMNSRAMWMVSEWCATCS